MAELSSSEKELMQRIIQLFREKGTPSSDGSGNSVELLLKDIVQLLGVEKKTVNRVLHHKSSTCFTKVKESPPLWRCKLDQDSTNVTSPAIDPVSPIRTDGGHSIGVDAGPEDVVVKKKEEVNSPSKKERLKPDVLGVLNASSSSLAALQIAKKLGYETAGDVNPTLYALKDEGKVTKLDGNKWSIAPNVSSISGATAGLHIDKTPMKLGEKALYTKEEVCEGGKREYRFREVLHEDVAPKNVEACDETDISKQPPLTSTQPDPIDEEKLAILSSLYDDPAESDLALKIVRMLMASGDTPLDDTDIFTKLNHSTRFETRPILESLEVNGLVEKIDGEVIQWKWKKSL